jgi:hypothetical protein
MAFWGRGGGRAIYKKGPYYTECGDIADGYCMVTKSLVLCRIFPALGPHFVRFPKQLSGYTALHYIVDRPNLQLSTLMVCLYKYHTSVTNLLSQALLKSIGSGICYPLGNF